MPPHFFSAYNATNTRMIFSSHVLSQQTAMICPPHLIFPHKTQSESFNLQCPVHPWPHSPSC